MRVGDFEKQLVASRRQFGILKFKARETPSHLRVMEQRVFPLMTQYKYQYTFLGFETSVEGG